MSIPTILKPKKLGQRRMLALDGGGIRGILTLGILERLERDLRDYAGGGSADFRLCDYFDFIGGTSTGAILAAGLVRGMSVSELIKFYIDAGPMMFTKDWLIKRLYHTYSADPLKEKLQKVLGKSTTLGSRSLKSLLLVVTRNMTTDSAWPVTNNPLAKYNDKTRDDCNLNLPLWQLIRASTAAPTFFPPEVVQLGSRDFVFVDGGTTPYNNPAFQMYRMAVSSPYKLNWETGESKMLLFSVGSGSAPQLGQLANNPHRWLAAQAKNVPSEMMSGMAYDQDINCRTVGRCIYGGSLDREVGDLVDADLNTRPNNGRDFLYARYDAELTSEGLDGLDLGHIDPEQVGELDEVDAIDDLLNIGRTYARKNVDIVRHLGKRFC